MFTKSISKKKNGVRIYYLYYRETLTILHSASNSFVYSSYGRQISFFSSGILYFVSYKWTDVTIYCMPNMGETLVN